MDLAAEELPGSLGCTGPTGDQEGGGMGVLSGPACQFTESYTYAVWPHQQDQLCLHFYKPRPRAGQPLAKGYGGGTGKRETEARDPKDWTGVHCLRPTLMESGLLG